MNSDIQYRYCADENGKLVCIDDLCVKNRGEHQYFCLDCGGGMTPKIGDVREHHFAHKTTIGCTGDGETYLHQFAKKRIKEAILDGELKTFNFTSNGFCKKTEECIYTRNASCVKKCWFQGNFGAVKEITEEQKVGKYIADLSLVTSDGLPAILIEIRVTHECSDQKKTSGLFIIETNIIENEQDVENIVSEGRFIDKINCKMYGIPEYLPSSVLGLKDINRLIISRDGDIRVINISCRQQNERIDNSSIVELNITSRDNQADMIFDGLCYLLNKNLTIPKLKYNQKDFKQRYNNEVRYSLFGLELHGIKEIYIDKTNVVSNPIKIKNNWRWK